MVHIARPIKYSLGLILTAIDDDTLHRAILILLTLGTPVRPADLHLLLLIPALLLVLRLIIETSLTCLLKHALLRMVAADVCRSWSHYPWKV